MNLFLGVLGALALVAGALWLFTWGWLRGPKLPLLDQATGQPFSTGPQPGPEHQAVASLLRTVLGAIKQVPPRQRLVAMRHALDTMFAARSFDVSFVPVDAGGVPAEWVLAPEADPNIRVLYIHGGSFMLGSPRSHRVLTSRYAELTGGAVLSIDYRLMPEHARQAGIDDCRAAYRWLLDNGPAGPAPVRTLVVAGDSAGGNLALSLIAWVRDQGLRPPDATVALSPFTDATLSSASLRDNVASDPMLGPLFGGMARLPHAVLLWLAWLQNRMRPCNPAISPLYGRLSGLPPVLVHASEAEMLRDDSRRYVNRAVAAGSPVTLQTWTHVVHVWHIFYPDLTEARQAFDEIEKFLRRHRCIRSSVAPTLH